MQSAQLVPKHSAQPAVMQPAYPREVKISSPRHLNRRARLLELVKQHGSATKVAAAVGTPKSHLSALMAGDRGLGDELAARLETAHYLPPGWFDVPSVQMTTTKAQAIAAMFDTLTPAEQSRFLRVFEAVADEPTRIMLSTDWGDLMDNEDAA